MTGVSRETGCVAVRWARPPPPAWPPEAGESWGALTRAALRGVAAKSPDGQRRPS